MTEDVMEEVAKKVRGLGPRVSNVEQQLEVVEVLAQRVSELEATLATIQTRPNVTAGNLRQHSGTPGANGNALAPERPWRFEAKDCAGCGKIVQQGDPARYRRADRASGARAELYCSNCGQGRA